MGAMPATHEPARPTTDRAVGAGFPARVTDCPCGRTALLAAASFCDQCGARLPELPHLDPSAVEDPHRWREPLSGRVECGLDRTLADVADGHIGLWGSPGRITIDRAEIDSALRGLDWVTVMLVRGWITEARGHRVLVLTPAGRERLANSDLIQRRRR